MSATITMNVTEARRRLGNTRALSSEQIDAAQRVIDRFQAERPRNRQCVACSCGQWSEHESRTDGTPIWCCASCHRPSSLTAEAWHVEWTRDRQAAEAHLAAAAAAEPKPRDRLREALARRAEANAAILKLERALPVARSTQTEAQTRHDAATEAAEAANGGAAELLAASFFTGTKPNGSAPSPAAARAELAAATDALVVARNAKAILDSRIESARTLVGFANDKAKKAAHGVLARDRIEALLVDVTENRAAYIDSVGSLAWLLQHHMIPTDDARARQLVSDANTPPSAWPEAKTAGVQVMEDALAALLDDPAPVI